MNKTDFLLLKIFKSKNKLENAKNNSSNHHNKKPVLYCFYTVQAL